NLKARFQLSLRVPKDWNVLANAPFREALTLDSTRSVVFKRSDLFSTYLFSFVAGRFAEATDMVEGRPMRFLYRETDTGKIRLSVDSVFNWHRRAIHFLEDYTQIPFPFQKLD